MWDKLANLFGKRDKLREPLDLGEHLRVDVHSHFIPGIDDGAQELSDSMDLLEGMIALGYKKVVTTPHVMSDYYRNSSETILEGRDLLRKTAEEKGLEIEIDAAAEYYLDAELMPKIKQKSLLTFGDQHVLFELPFMVEPPNLADVIFEMQLAGYKPVLAHPERYAFWHMSFEKYQEIHDKGVILQLNINSLTGHYSPDVKKISERLIEEEMIGLLGSDCHHMNHIGLLDHARRLPSLHRIIEQGGLLNQKLL